MLTRRGFFLGAICAPAIVRASSLMAISPVQLDLPLMPVPIFWNYAVTGLREDLTSVIFNITPTETPFLASLRMR